MEEEIQSSKIDLTCRFYPYGHIDMRDIIKTRRTFIKCTQMLWINKYPVVTSCGEAYNPKALIMIFLN